jgi:hypothetical protein
LHQAQSKQEICKATKAKESKKEMPHQYETITQPHLQALQLAAAREVQELEAFYFANRAKMTPAQRSVLDSTVAVMTQGLRDNAVSLEATAAEASAFFLEDCDMAQNMDEIAARDEITQWNRDVVVSKAENDCKILTVAASAVKQIACTFLASLTPTKQSAFDFVAIIAQMPKDYTVFSEGIAKLACMENCKIVQSNRDIVVDCIHSANRATMTPAKQSVLDSDVAAIAQGLKDTNEVALALMQSGQMPILESNRSIAQSNRDIVVATAENNAAKMILTVSVIKEGMIASMVTTSGGDDNNNNNNNNNSTPTAGDASVRLVVEEDDEKKPTASTIPHSSSCSSSIVTSTTTGATVDTTVPDPVNAGSNVLPSSAVNNDVNNSSMATTSASVFVLPPNATTVTTLAMPFVDVAPAASDHSVFTPFAPPSPALTTTTRTNKRKSDDCEPSSSLLAKKARITCGLPAVDFTFSAKYSHPTFAPTDTSLFSMGTMSTKTPNSASKRRRR